MQRLSSLLFPDFLQKSTRLFSVLADADADAEEGKKKPADCTDPASQERGMGNENKGSWQKEMQPLTDSGEEDTKHAVRGKVQIFHKSLYWPRKYGMDRNIGLYFFSHGSDILPVAVARYSRSRVTQLKTPRLLCLLSPPPFSLFPLVVVWCWCWWWKWKSSDNSGGPGSGDSSHPQPQPTVHNLRAKQTVEAGKRKEASFRPSPVRVLTTCST